MLTSLALLAAYLLGAIPTAFIIGKRIGGIDIREHGSGNVGTTNAFRVLGKGPGIIVLLIDIFKGYVAVALCLLVGGPDLGLLGAIIAMVGHSWTVFLKFKGGKGVATGAGAFFALMPKVVLAAIIIFVVLIYFTRYVSVGSIFAALSVPIFTYIFQEKTIYKVFGLFAALVVIFRHIPNIKRLIQGTESKIGQK